MKFKDIFTFLKESKLYAEAKTRVVALLKTKKVEFKGLAETYLKEKSPIIKENTINFIMEHIELKFPYKFFKGKIRKVLNKNFDKLVEFILAKLQEV